MSRTRTACVVALAVLAASCTSSPPRSGGSQQAPANCTVVDMAASPEKFDLLSGLAQAFNGSPVSRRNGCAFVRLENKSSGAAASLLADGWPDPATNGPRPAVAAYNRSVESAVVHYGDTTLTFLANLLRNDARGAALTYVSAVAVEEKSVLDYNRGIPSGSAPAGETPRPPRVPLVAVYPKEGTLLPDNPFYVLDAPWVSAEAKRAART